MSPTVGRGMDPASSSRQRQPSTLEMLYGARGSDTGLAELAGVAAIWVAGCAVVLKKATALGQLFTCQASPGLRQRWLLYALQYFVFSALHSLAIDATRHLQSRLALKWRRNVTCKLHDMYFQRMAYYRIQAEVRDQAVTDADTRICRDVWEMAAATSEVAVSLTEALIKTFVFTSAAMVYSHWAWALSPSLFALVAVKIMCRAQPTDGNAVLSSLQQVEGRLKQSFARLQDDVDKVVMLQGEAFELDVLQKCVKDVLVAAKKKLEVMFLLEMREDMFFPSTQGAAIIELAASFSSACLCFFDRQLAPVDAACPPAAELAGRHVCHVQCFFNAFSGWDSFLTARTLLMTSSPATSRVKQLYVRLDRLHASISKSRGGRRRASVSSKEAPQKPEVFLDRGPTISFEGVSIPLPSKQALLRDLTFNVAEGQPLLICGQVGAGKSAVARCLFSLWPVTSGHIARPGGAVRVEECIPLAEDITYLPEAPLVGMVSCLSDQITYPTKLAGGLQYEELMQWLSYVGLGHIFQGAADLEPSDWSSCLTLAEQQALGFARLLYHRPRFAVLDESTSAMTVKQEQRLVGAARELGICCITLARRAHPALADEHLRILQLQGAKGEDTRGWKLRDLPKTSSPLTTRPRCRSVAEAHQRLKAYLCCTANADSSALTLESPNDYHSDEQDMSSTFSRAASGPPCLANVSTTFSRATSSSSSSSSPAWSDEAVQRRWPSQMSRLRATIQLGLLTASRRRTVLQKVVVALLLLPIRTKLYWQFCRCLAGVVRALMVRKTSLAAAELSIGGAAVMACGFIDQLLRHQASSAALELWAGAVGHLQRKLLRDSVLLHVIGRVEKPVQRLAELRGVFESLASVVSDALVPTANLAVTLPVLVRSLGLWPLALLAGQMALQYGMQKACLDSDAIPSQSSLLESHFQAMHSWVRRTSEAIAFTAGGSYSYKMVGQQFEAIVESGLPGRSLELLGRATSTFLTDFRQLPSLMVRVLSLQFVQSLHGVPLPHALSSSFLFDRMAQNAQVSFQNLAKCTEKARRLDAQCLRCLQLAISTEMPAKKAVQATTLQSPGLLEPPEGKSGEAAVTLGFRNMDLVAPDGSALARNLDFEVLPGEPFLVTGPAGCGKSTLSRALLGVSNSAAGQRSMLESRPPLRRVMLVTHQPYFPTGCRLLAQLAYPSVLKLPSRPPFSVHVVDLPSAISESDLRDHFAALGASDCQVVQSEGSRVGIVSFRTFEDTIRAVARPQDRVVGNVELNCEIGGAEGPDAEFVSTAEHPPPHGTALPRLSRMRRCLRAVGLDHVLVREQEGWLARRIWQDVLSLQEQQQLCLARVLYHQPTFCILDDASSAVPDSTEAELHQVLLAWNVTPVALSRRPFLTKFYLRELRLGLTPENDHTDWEIHQLASEVLSEEHDAA